MGDLPDDLASGESDPSTMIRATDEYWDSDRASYEDELGAWRERTAVAATQLDEAPVTRSAVRRPTHRSTRRPMTVVVAIERRPARHARPPRSGTAARRRRTYDQGQTAFGR